jgi:hypothetical protein
MPKVTRNLSGLLITAIKMQLESFLAVDILEQLSFTKSRIS